jgi:hypothetical protein
MIDQLDFLKSAIATARSGNEGAVTLLREICRQAADKAPPPDLIALADCLHHIGIEAARRELDRN